MVCSTILIVDRNVSRLCSFRCLQWSIISQTVRNADSASHLISTPFSSGAHAMHTSAWHTLKTLRRDPLSICDARTVTDSNYQLCLGKSKKYCDKQCEIEGAAAAAAVLRFRNRRPWDPGIQRLAIPVYSGQSSESSARTPQSEY